MRILIVGSDPRQGLLYYPVRLACAMKAFGHEVRVATWGDRAQTSNLRTEATEAGLELLSAPSLAKSGLRALLGPSLRLRRAVWTWQPDVVQTFGPVSNAQAFVAGSRALRVVSIEAMGHGSNSPWPARAGAMLLTPLAHAVVALCKEEMGRLRRAWVPAEKLHVIYNPIDCSDLVGKAARAQAERGTLLAALGAPGSRLPRRWPRTQAVRCRRRASGRPRGCTFTLKPIEAHGSGQADLKTRTAAGHATLKSRQPATMTIRAIVTPARTPNIPA